MHGEQDVYAYDGDGKRVKKDFSQGERVRFVYGVGGDLMAEFGAAAGAREEEYKLAFKSPTRRIGDKATLI